MPDEEKIIAHIRELFSEFGIDQDPAEMWAELKALSPAATPKKRRPKVTPAVVKLQRQLQQRGVDIPVKQLRQAFGSRAETTKLQRKALQKKARAAKKG
jgi:hypothetical protein